MADEFDFLDQFGLSENDIVQPSNAYEKYLLDLSNKITEDFKKYIDAKARNTGGLAAATYGYVSGPLTITVVSDDYFSYVDEGVNAVGTNNYGSRFSFKYPGVSHNMATAISQWKGMDMSHAYAVAYNIKQRGLKPRNITENVMTDDVLNMIASDLATVTGLLFDITFTKNTKKWQ